LPKIEDVSALGSFYKKHKSETGDDKMKPVAQRPVSYYQSTAEHGHKRLVIYLAETVDNTSPGHPCRASYYAKKAINGKRSLIVNLIVNSDMILNQ